jgi:hypothetical protein
MRRVKIGLVAGVLVLPLAAAGPAEAKDRPDGHYRVRAGHTLQVRGDAQRDGAVVRHTDPGHGALTIGPAGSFRYTPAAGFTGRDTFTYTVSDAVRLYPTKLPPLGTVGGVKITGGGYGSALTPVPGSRDEFYGLTDRGPNVDAPDGSKVEPLPSFTPAIGKFRLRGGKAVLERNIPLRAADGSPYNGQVNTLASTARSSRTSARTAARSSVSRRSTVRCRRN